MKADGSIAICFHRLIPENAAENHFTDFTAKPPRAAKSAKDLP
jgi:hypothetical protein